MVGTTSAKTANLRSNIAAWARPVIVASTAVVTVFVEIGGHQQAPGPIGGSPDAAYLGILLLSFAVTGIVPELDIAGAKPPPSLLQSIASSSPGPGTLIYTLSAIGGLLALDNSAQALGTRPGRWLVSIAVATVSALLLMELSRCDGTVEVICNRGYQSRVFKGGAIRSIGYQSMVFKGEAIRSIAALSVLTIVPLPIVISVIRLGPWPVFWALLFFGYIIRVCLPVYRQSPVSVGISPYSVGLSSSGFGAICAMSFYSLAVGPKAQSLILVWCSAAALIGIGVSVYGKFERPKGAVPADDAPQPSILVRMPGQTEAVPLNEQLIGQDSLLALLFLRPIAAICGFAARSRTSHEPLVQTVPSDLGIVREKER